MIKQFQIILWMIIGVAFTGKPVSAQVMYDDYIEIHQQEYMLRYDVDFKTYLLFNLAAAKDSIEIPSSILSSDSTELENILIFITHLNVKNQRLYLSKLNIYTLDRPARKIIAFEPDSSDWLHLNTYTGTLRIDSGPTIRRPHPHGFRSVRTHVKILKVEKGIITSMETRSNIERDASLHNRGELKDMAKAVENIIEAKLSDSNLDLNWHKAGILSFFIWIDEAGNLEVERFEGKEKYATPIQQTLQDAGKWERRVGEEGYLAEHFKILLIFDKKARTYKAYVFALP